MKWNSKLYDDTHHFVSQYGSDMITLLQPKKRQIILDIGCGTGDIAFELTQRGCQVTGLDSSAEMIATAKDKFPEIRFIQANAIDFELHQKFDVVFSNATFHWIAKEDQPKVLRQVYRHLNPGGRFIAEFGGAGNILKIREALRTVLKKSGFANLADADRKTWYFPETKIYKKLLREEGFHITSIKSFKRPTPLFEGYEGLQKWLTMFGKHWFTGLDKNTQDILIAEVERLLEPELFRNGKWMADYVRLRFDVKRNQDLYKTTNTKTQNYE